VEESSVLTFLFSLLVFDLLYSFVIGLALMVPAVLISDSPEHSSQDSQTDGRVSWGQVLIMAFTILVAAALCAGHGLIVAEAVNISLVADPGRWRLLWWILGFLFSVPLALVQSFGKSEDSTWEGVGCLISIATYIMFITIPSLPVGPFKTIGRWLAA
jgi:hypothetical protein